MNLGVWSQLNFRAMINSRACNLVFCFLLFFVSACSSNRPMLRTDYVMEDIFNQESFLRYSTSRLELLGNTPYAALAKCHGGDSGGGLALLKQDAFVKLDSPRYWNQVGACYFVLKDYAKAAFYFDFAIKKSGKKSYAPALNNLGVLSLALKHDHEALDYFKQAYKSNRSLIVPQFNLAQIYLRFHLLDPAKKILQELYRKNDQDVEVVYALGNLYLLQQNIELAYQLLESIPEDKKQREDITLVRALALHQRGKYRQALVILSEQSFGQIPLMKESAEKLEKLLEYKILKSDNIKTIAVASPKVDTKKVEGR